MSVLIVDDNQDAAESGFDLALALWAMPAHRELPIFAVSGYGLADDRRKTAQAGFKGHLVKPVAVEQIEKVLRDTVVAGA